MGSHFETPTHHADRAKPTAPTPLRHGDSRRRLTIAVDSRCRERFKVPDHVVRVGRHSSPVHAARSRHQHIVGDTGTRHHADHPVIVSSSAARRPTRQAPAAHHRHTFSTADFHTIMWAAPRSMR